MFEIYELVFELGQITFYIIAILIKKTIKTNIKKQKQGNHVEQQKTVFSSEPKDDVSTITYGNGVLEFDVVKVSIEALMFTSFLHRGHKDMSIRRICVCRLRNRNSKEAI